LNLLNHIVEGLQQSALDAHTRYGNVGIVIAILTLVLAACLPLLLYTYHRFCLENLSKRSFARKLEDYFNDDPPFEWQAEEVLLATPIFLKNQPFGGFIVRNDRGSVIAQIQNMGGDECNFDIQGSHFTVSHPPFSSELRLYRGYGTEQQIALCTLRRKYFLFKYEFPDSLLIKYDIDKHILLEFKIFSDYSVEIWHENERIGAVAYWSNARHAAVALALPAIIPMECRTLMIAIFGSHLFRFIFPFPGSIQALTKFLRAESVVRHLR
jgi:hypothetical protein